MKKLLLCISLILTASLCFTGCTAGETVSDISAVSNVSDTVTASSNVSSSSQSTSSAAEVAVSSKVSASSAQSSEVSRPTQTNIPSDTSSDTVSKDDSKVTNIETDGKKLVAFTFDDGPNEYSMKLYKTFWENGGHCTFFVIGKNVSAQYSNILKNFVKNGNQIGNHSYSHERMTSLISTDIAADFTRCQETVKTYVDYDMTLARLPNLAGDIKVYSVMKQLNLPCIAGIDTSASSVGPLTDYVPSFSSEKIQTCVEETIYDGAIFLCHSTSNTSDAMEQLLPKLKSMGYAFVTVDEMMKLKGHSTIPLGCQIVDGLLKIR